ncbi:hypothetical protein [Hymenobacter volaticus]|uniref:Uncharacterized protein n=1 Tax=Hymenobacter volaticus TaxID=2932254 RepID=A0ABY4GE16_9BACT|nr:hypothetical protein [Hymenobacter volaticus]UOQ69041.1 hypothetical protein MUN86_26425 [Hymenobacter volaticus]
MQSHEPVALRDILLKKHLIEGIGHVADGVEEDYSTIVAQGLSNEEHSLAAGIDPDTVVAAKLLHGGSVTMIVPFLNPKF